MEEVEVQDFKGEKGNSHEDEKQRFGKQISLPFYLYSRALCFYSFINTHMIQQNIAHTTQQTLWNR